MKIISGQKVPGFSLYDSTKIKINIRDFEGKKNVLLLFFPLAFTGVCTKELCAVRDDIGRYGNDGVQVLGISVDSVFTLAKYKEEQQLNYPLLSDFNKEVSTLFDVLYTSFTHMNMKGVSKRSTFIIDKQGVIQYIEILENAGALPDFKAINDKITSLA